MISTSPVKGPHHLGRGAPTGAGGGGGGFRRQQQRRGSAIFLILLLGMVVGVVFICGLYVGSAFMQSHNSLDFKPTFHILSQRHLGIRGGGARLRGAKEDAIKAAGASKQQQEQHVAMKRKNPVQAVLNNILDARHRPTPPAIVQPAVNHDEIVEKLTHREAPEAVQETVQEEARPPPLPPAAALVPTTQPQQVNNEKPKGVQQEEDRFLLAVSKWPLPTVLSVAGSSGMLVSSEKFGQLTASVDELSLTVSAWIYLDQKKASTTMNTVLANKASGCEVTPDRMGYALYVNTWETTDRQLILEWGNEQSGCAKLGSGQSGTLIEHDTWTHVAAVLTSACAALYINGKEVAMSRPIERKIQDKEGMMIGRHTDGQYPFNGRIASVAFFRESLDEAYLKEVASKPLDSAVFSSTESLVLALPLNDAPIKPKDPKHMHDTKGNIVGAYSMHFDSGSLDDLLDGIPEAARGDVTIQMQEESDRLGRERRGQIRNSMQRVWKAYRQHAWGHDELKPVSLTGHDNWGGIGCTLVDSLDTLWLMGLKDEFSEARDWVRDSLTFAHTGSVSVFETTIRELGGLVSAYDLSGDIVFLRKARELGDRLLGAFNTPSGIPMGQTNLQTKQSSNAGWTGGAAILAELGTLQIEFRYLSAKTGNPVYAEKVNKVFDLMAEKHPVNGLYPIYVSPANGNFQNNQVTFGALGDSFYEYLLKVWLQGGKKESAYRRMFDDAMDGMMKVLLKRSKPSGLLYVSDLEGGHNVHKMDHLACFLPAVLALGAITMEGRGTEDEERAERYMKVAKGLTHTCYQMYHRYPTHLAPEFVRFVDGQDMVPGANFYILRPETAEALFYLHEITGDPIYREWSWEIFQAIDRYCRTDEAYGAHPDVTSTNRHPDDRMESFFLAETMKYLYLIQDPDHPIDLKKHVFNTEAHPLKMFASPPGRGSGDDFTAQQ